MTDISVTAYSDPYHCHICHAMVKMGKMAEHREWHRNLSSRERG
jgi:hypothetical protein